MRPLSDFDRAMIKHAIARGPVIVQDGERTRLATLMAWRPPRHDSSGRHRTNKARVRYPRGTFASVPIDKVRLP